jgi:hypothetical protein
MDGALSRVDLNSFPRIGQFLAQITIDAITSLLRNHSESRKLLVSFSPGRASLETWITSLGGLGHMSVYAQNAITVATHIEVFKESSFWIRGPVTEYV